MRPHSILHDRFWAKVDKSGACWLWTAHTVGSGYGGFWDTVRNVCAHRWAYEERFGPIPDGLQIDHLCRTRICVRPAHLEAVTQTENILRGISFSAEKARQTHCKRGHRLAGRNVRVPPGRPGSRACRTCARLRHRGLI